MQDQLDELARAASDLAKAAADKERPDGQGLSARATRLAERLGRRRFNVSVLGEFKRGKSTLINALLGAELMPTGVLPLTAVVTEVAYGQPGATVVNLDGSSREIELADLAEYVTEAANPANVRKVSRVEARCPVELLRPGVVLVDTPGIGSVFRHNDETATRALLEADGAILVLSADAPLSEAERQLLAVLSERQAPTFFVLNRVDHLSPAERVEVSHFVTEALAGELGRQERLWCVSARAALSARLAGQSPRESQAGDFPAFCLALRRFVDRDLVQARIGTATAELGRLAGELDEALVLEAAAADLDAATLHERVEGLSQAAGRQRKAFEDDRTLLERDVAGLAAGIAQALAEFAERQPARWDDHLVEASRTVPVHQLEYRLRQSIETAVRESFDEFREAEAAQAELSWRRLAEQFRDVAQARVNAVRTAAADIFQVTLPHVVIPEVAEETERYFYLFLHVGSSTEGFDRLVRRLLPARFVRRRLLQRARHDLAGEFDKHAGRARWDLTQRLEAVRRRFEAAVSEELARSVATVLDATRRAEDLRSALETERRDHQRRNNDARQVAASALALAARLATGPGRQP
jgi:hypothetical protein